MLQSQIIRYAISRSKLDDIPTILQSWRYLGKEEIETLELRHKHSIAPQINSLCEEKSNFNHDKAGELDLVYTQTYPSKRNWTVHRMEDSKGGNTKDQCNPQKIKKKLKSQLILYFDGETSVSVRLHKESLWGRMYIQVGNNNTFNPNNVVFFVHKPKTPYIVISRYKVSIEEFLLQCLQNSFGYSSITKMQLTGHHVDSLMQLASNRQSQGAFSKFRVGQVQNVPLVSRRPQKRKEPDYEKDPSICCEDELRKKFRSDKLEETFGPDEQPLLEKIEYKVSVKFRGTQIAPGMSNIDEPFHCRVKFEGPAVLEGIRNMASCGLATVPLPHHLGGVSSLAKNYFVLEDKTKNNKDKSQLDKSKNSAIHH